MLRDFFTRKQVDKLIKQNPMCTKHLSENKYMNQCYSNKYHALVRIFLA